MGLFNTENFSFCVEKIKITIVYQPQIMMKSVIRGDGFDPIEVHPRNEWLKFFEMLLREFQNDECYKLFVYDHLKLNAFSKLENSFNDVTGQYYDDVIFVNPDEPDDFIQQRPGVKEPIKGTVYPTGSHTFFKELSASTDEETRNVILYISELKIDTKTERVLEKLYKGKQYSVIIFSYVMFAPQFDWLPFHRNLCYNLGRQIEQYNDIRNMLRNPNYAGTELFVHRNLSEISLSGEEQEITLWLIDTDKNTLNL